MWGVGPVDNEVGPVEREVGPPGNEVGPIDRKAELAADREMGPVA